LNLTGGKGEGHIGLRFVLGALVLLLIWPLSASAQDSLNDRIAPVDSLLNEIAPETESALERAVREIREREAAGETRAPDTGPFFISLSNTPKAGARANVRQNTYYSELVSKLKMRSNASFTNTLKWSFEEYRKQNKNVERRSNNFTYSLGQTLPLITNLDGSWSWSNDKTINTAGFANLFAQDDKNLRLSASKTKARTGAFVHTLRFGATVTERQSENQSTANNTSEGSTHLGLQTGWNISPGIVLSGRLHGKAASGTKTLGTKDSPSTTQGDTLGIGVYYDRGIGRGRVAISRSNFRNKYLDFKKNSNGLIDTVGVAEDLKVVDELETKDAMSIEFENFFSLGPMSFQSTLSRTTDDLNYATSGQGLKERQLDDVKLQSGLRVGADSLSVSYEYIWKWDDQRIQGATINRGRQYNKSRNLEFLWQRPLFQETDFRLRYFQGLSQDIAQFVHNQNDKDRLQNDFILQLERTWSEIFRAKMVYTYRQVEDISIRESRSSNNNIKDSYEINPGYTWYVAPWLTWNQDYRVYIQYTDFVFSELESVSRDDNYNKRGNLTSKVTLRPTKRLELVLRHDFNKKFNATKSGTNAAGSAFYDRDLNQTIGKLDLGLTFNIAPGVTLETATYRTRDDRESFGRTISETTEYSGEIWVGTKINKTWRKAITLSALVKKFNAYGPSVTETSANYWEADIWLKWEF
jgi:hypothetical protein